MKKLLILITIGGLILGLALNAMATPITFSQSSGSLAASAIFDSYTSGGNNFLKVTLTNTSTADVLVPTDVLTAVFFTIAGGPSLTRVSAVLASGSTVLFDDPPSRGVVGGEWAYKNHLSGAPDGADEGISSTGLGLFGSGNRFPGSNLQGPNSPDGLQYGITSAGDNPATGNTPVTGTNALIKNSVIFRLSGLPSGFDPSADRAITDVSFLYGTSLNEGGGTPVPEPGTLILLGSGLVSIGIWGRKKFRARI